MGTQTAKKRTGSPKEAMLPFPARCQHGGRRAGAGRKPKGETAGVHHREREALASRFPVHVTVKLLPGLPRLRSKCEY
ncbi:MAG TPA: hypothetical protein VFZ65_09480, partial [Planctomycetota bacterium]|nr:hypothetical protein [Planctomycetota bacterium]